MGGARGEGCLNQVLPHFPTQVLEILKLLEEEEEAHTLKISIYDTKRNEKSREYREAMVSLAPSPAPTFSAPPGLRLMRMMRDSAGQPSLGDEVIDLIVLILAAEPTIPMFHPKGHSGPRPGLPHLQGLRPAPGLFCRREGEACAHLHLRLPSSARPGHGPEFSIPCRTGRPGYPSGCRARRGFEASF